MTTKYTRADLLWEATRRNEDYKSDYISVLGKYRNDLKDYGSITELPYVSFKRWGIVMVKESETRLKIFGWLDPEIDVNEINKKISSGVNPLSVHPYAYLHELSITNPNMYYHLMQKSPGQHFSEQKIDDDIYVCIKKDLVRNRFLALIDPLSEDAFILKSIKQIKKKILKEMKREINSLKKKGEMVFFPRDVGDYIGWLKKYDSITDHARKQRGEAAITIKKGAVIIPDDFRFQDLVPDDTHGEKFEGQRKAYRDAYRGAVHLIQTTPDIIFSPART